MEPANLKQINHYGHCLLRNVTEGDIFLLNFFQRVNIEGGNEKLFLNERGKKLDKIFVKGQFINERLPSVSSSPVVESGTES